MTPILALMLIIFPIYLLALAVWLHLSMLGAPVPPPPPKTAWQKLRTALGHPEVWLGILAVLATVIVAVLLITQRALLNTLSSWGYLGLFLVSTLGGSVSLIPVPAVAIQFTLGGVLHPPFGPLFLGPILIGLVGGLAEAIGGLTIYSTGYIGGTLFNAATKNPRFKNLYLRLEDLMRRRGSIVLFLSCVFINPFHYPISLAAGALEFGSRKYFLVAWSGLTIKCMSIAFAGFLGLSGLLHLIGVET